MEVEDYASKIEDTINTNVDFLLDKAQCRIVADALRRELNE